MKKETMWKGFLLKAMRDEGITSWDISLYMALLYNWYGSEYQYPASITR